MTALTTADIIGQVRDLPSLSTVVMELLHSLDQEDIDIGSLAAKVAHDQALAAKSLRLANSSFYGMQRKITTIHEAVAVLGFRTVRSLVTTAALTDSFARQGNRSFDFAAFWRHSIGTAVCAKGLARQLKMNQEYAYTTGLLHDIGRLVLVTRFASQYQLVLNLRQQQDCFLIDAERAVLGIDHAAVGQALAEHWKFPEAMQLAVALHHKPDEARDDALAALIHIADAIAQALDFSGEEDALVPPISPAAWKRLNMQRISFNELFCTAQAEFERACQVLSA